MLVKIFQMLYELQCELDCLQIDRQINDQQSQNIIQSTLVIWKLKGPSETL